MSSDFYRVFEERFRGSRESIKSGLRIYLPFVFSLKKVSQDCQAVDVGCGRGEWLELMRNIGVQAIGVDLDDGMLEACRKLNLPFEKADAISFIESLPDESKDLITGFQFVEHIPVEELQKLIQQALRVLRPAGLLIMETQNPENFLIGSSRFYLDPTHRRPIPPQLLAYLPEYYGFRRIKLMYLQQSSKLVAKDTINLSDLFYGICQDYAVVAQKEAPGSILAVFDREFDAKHGLSFEQLVNQYDWQTSQEHLHPRSDLSRLVRKLVLRLREKVSKL